MTADLLSDPPDLVIAVLSRASDDEKREFVPEAYVNGFALLDEIGIPTLAIRMYPTIDAEDWQCLIESKEEHPCAIPRDRVLGLDEDVLGVTLPATTQVVDTTSYWCLEGACPAVIGNVSVYYDRWHLSDAYVTTMGFLFAEAVERVLF